MKYRKKPIVIDAYRVTEKFLNDDDGTAPQWIEDAVGNGRIVFAGNEILVRTLEDGVQWTAKHVAQVGDWIIMGIKGEIYPIRPDIFEATYEAVS
jgi:hypothetical protein